MNLLRYLHMMQTHVEYLKLSNCMYNDRWGARVLSPICNTVKYNYHTGLLKRALVYSGGKRTAAQLDIYL